MLQLHSLVGHLQRGHLMLSEAQRKKPLLLLVSQGGKALTLRSAGAMRIPERMMLILLALFVSTNVMDTSFCFDGCLNDWTSISCKSASRQLGTPPALAERRCCRGPEKIAKPNKTH